MSHKTTLDNEKLIRNVEQQLLDQEYKKFDFLKHSEEVCILHVLKAYGDLFRDLTNFETDYSQQSVLTMIHITERAVGHCIRWIRLDHSQDTPNTADRLVGLGDRKLDQEAAEFLRFGISYDQLFNDHVAWSRKQKKAHIDFDKKHIWFEDMQGLDWKFYVSQLQANEVISLRYGERFPLNPRIAEFRNFARNFKITGNRTEAPIEICNTKPFEDLLVFFAGELLPTLDSNFNFGGYTLSEFRQFTAAFTLYGLYAIWLENYMDRRFGDENILGSLALGTKRNEALAFLNSISKVNIKCITEIINDLTFDITNIHSMLANQPFITGENEMIYCAPRIAGNHPPGRMLTGALNKSSKRKTYESVIEHLQNKELDIIEAAFKSIGLCVIREREIRIANQKIKPDLLIFEKKNPDVVVIDYKHSLSPLGPSEVMYRQTDIQKAILQVSRYVDLLRSDITELEKTIRAPVRARGLHGLVLYRWPMAVLMKTSPSVGIIDWPTLKNKISETVNMKPDDIYRFVKDRPDVDFDPNNLDKVDHEIQIQDWKYTHTAYAY